MENGDPATVEDDALVGGGVKTKPVFAEDS